MMSYRALVIAVSLSATVVSAREEKVGAAKSGLSGPVFAMPDPRDCVSPVCGGYFLRDTTEEACSDQFVFLPESYVTRVVIREPNGSLTNVSPACSEPLSGAAEADPEYPSLRMYVLGH